MRIETETIEGLDADDAEQRVQGYQKLFPYVERLGAYSNDWGMGAGYFIVGFDTKHAADYANSINALFAHVHHENPCFGPLVYTIDIVRAHGITLSSVKTLTVFLESVVRNTSYNVQRERHGREW